MTDDTDDAPDPVDLLVEEFSERRRAGEPLTVEGFIAGYPKHAKALREVLPAVAFLEKGKREMPGSLNESSTVLRAIPDGPLFSRIGDNRVVREIGRGGMGIVYEAVQEPLGRRVAVKVLPRHAHGNASGRERFVRETRVIARLDHPNIVAVHSAGEQEGVPYYVMAFIDGVGLDQVASDPASHLPVDPAQRANRVAEIGRQAADALAYAHAQGVLHRDIKPANLLLAADGTLRLADFGLAKLTDDHSLTGTGELPGTLRYLAPECLHGEADARSDVYSLGLTLYEILVGRPAFPEINWARLLQQVGQGTPPTPRDLVPGLPIGLERVILKAMAREPSDRYPGAADLEADLARFLRGDPIGDHRPPTIERLARWGRRNRLVAALGATSLVLAALTAYFGTLFLIAPGPPRRDGFGPPEPRPPDSRPFPPPRKKAPPPLPRPS